MPQVTAFNLRKEDRLLDIEEAVRRALVSMPELGINAHEVDLFRSSSLTTSTEQ